MGKKEKPSASYLEPFERKSGTMPALCLRERLSWIKQKSIWVSCRYSQGCSWSVTTGNGTHTGKTLFQLLSDFLKWLYFYSRDNFWSSFFFPCLEISSLGESVHTLMSAHQIHQQWSRWHHSGWREIQWKRLQCLYATSVLDILYLTRQYLC